MLDPTKKEPTVVKEGKRRNGSILAALLCVVGLIVAAFWVAFGGLPIDDRLEKPTDIAACVVFALVLLWWVFSPPGPGPRSIPLTQIFFLEPNDERNWGIGMETIMMVVTILTAVVAIVTLVHEFFKPYVH